MPGPHQLMLDVLSRRTTAPMLLASVFLGVAVAAPGSACADDETAPGDERRDTVIIVNEDDVRTSAQSVLELIQNHLRTTRPGSQFQKLIQIERAARTSDDVARTMSHTISIEFADGELTIMHNGTPVTDEQLELTPSGLLFQAPTGEHVPLRFGDASLFGTTGLPGTATQFQAENNVDVHFVPRTMVGLHHAEPDDALRYQLELQPGEATLIEGVYQGLPAWNAGLRAFDVVVAVDGERPAGPNVMRRIIDAKDVGDQIELEVVRHGERHTLAITLAPYDGVALNSAAIAGRSPKTTGSTVLVGPDGNFFFKPKGGDLEFSFDHTIDIPEIRRRLRSGNAWIESDLHQQLHDHLMDHFPVDRLLAPRETNLAPSAESASERRLAEHVRALEARIRRLEALLEATSGRPQTPPDGDPPPGR